MTVKRASDRTTVPIGVAILGALVVGTGWLVLQGLPFIVGCVATFCLAGAAIVLLTTPLNEH
jgi:hypothetical protein